MRRGYLLVALGSGLLFLGLAAGGATAHPGGPLAASAGSAQIYLDPTGDSGGALPDITSVSVGDDPLTGVIQITASALGVLPAEPGTNHDVLVYLDTHGTGHGPSCNCRYVVDFSAGPDSEAAALWQWNGKWTRLPSTTPSFFRRDGERLIWRFKRSEAEITGDFTFYIVASSQTAGNDWVNTDVAPDLGAWSYDLSTAVRPLIGSAHLAPATPVAGKRLTVTFAVTRSDDGQPLTTATMICDPSVERKVIAHSESFRDGTARLSFLVPRSAKAKALKVSLKIRTGAGAIASKTASFRVR